MNIETIKHKGLERLHQSLTPKNVKGLPSNVVEKLHRQMTTIQAATNLQQINSVPGWDLHQLEPKSDNKWALKVTGNWRLVFTVDLVNGTVGDLDYVDYH